MWQAHRAQAKVAGWGEMLSRLGACAWIRNARRLGVIEGAFYFHRGVVVLAVAFAAGVGPAFGYFPARRTARLDPIGALRHE